MRKIFQRLNWILSAQFGLNILVVLSSFRGLPRYIKNWFEFRRAYSGRMSLTPCLHDWYEEAGSTSNEYFWQDILVARLICDAKPARHVDVGSRVDGFVAHVAVFREIEVFDVRPVTTKIENIRFTQADLMSSSGLPDVSGGYCDSLSCLHALEHFGLGRYGDPIDPQGHEKGLANMAQLLTRGGTFYLSVPIGIECVEFNANRIFDPRTILTLAGRSGLSLKRLIVIRPGETGDDVNPDVEMLDALAKQPYGLGIFVFAKE